MPICANGAVAPNALGSRPPVAICAYNVPPGGDLVSRVSRSRHEYAGRLIRVLLLSCAAVKWPRKRVVNYVLATKFWSQ